MNDLAFHLILFAFAGSVIVLISSFFGEPDDRKAVRALPKRILVFFGGCALIAAIILVLEHTVASVY